MTKVGKLKRSHLIHYIKFPAMVEWFLIGKDIEDMSVELNPSTETKKNILDETVVTDTGYEPSVSVDTYYANTDDTIYEPISNIAMNRLTGDDCKAELLEILVDTVEGPYKAWKENIIVKPQSYGGSQGGVNIPYNIAFDGNRKEGTATITDKVPTFTANS